MVGVQFLPKEHRHAAEQSWNTCHREMERIANMRVAETIRTQQAEIERLKEYEDAVYAHFDVACHSYDANKSVYENLSMLQSWHCEIALDPKVSKPANELHSEIERLKSQRDRLLNVDRLAEIIRKVDGNHNLGAGRLAEMIIAEIEAEND